MAGFHVMLAGRSLQPSADERVVGRAGVPNEIRSPALIMAFLTQVVCDRDAMRGSETHVMRVSSILQDFTGRCEDLMIERRLRLAAQTDFVLSRSTSSAHQSSLSDQKTVLLCRYDVK